MTTFDRMSTLAILKNKEITEKNSFDILKTICSLANRSEQNYDPKAQELLLRALDQRDQFGKYGAILNGLARQMGLYPYMLDKDLTSSDAIAREFHRPENFALDESVQKNLPASRESLIFHRAQAFVFRKILDGGSVILSAPTSFGKSSIIDALVESGKFTNLAIVVPTIALIDETRRRLSRFRGSHKIITHASQELADANIFVFTQERVIDYPKFPPLDLFVLDEFYKLDPSGDKERSATLNLAFYKLTKRAKQFYLLGPNIQHIPDGFPKRFRCEFIRTDFSTVVTELIPVNAPKGKESDSLVKLCRNLNEATLIFCASPAKARKIARLLCQDSLVDGGEGMPGAAEWVGNNYHKEWSLVDGFRRGIGMHHGRMPRALAQLAVRGFNEGKLKFLVCTSTLIEGVNTKAKNVVIFDNKIATQKYDYFTFNNIRGRSGRMFKHFVGHVYLFHDEPQPELPFVDIPMFSQDAENTSLSLLIQMDEEDLKKESKNRLSPYLNQSLLSLDVLRENSGIDPESQLNLAREFGNNAAALLKAGWSGMPDYQQVEFLCVLIWEYFIAESGRIAGVSSGRQLALKLNRLRYMSLNQLIADERKSTESIDDAVEGVLEFLRQWPQFRFGRLAMAVARIQNELAIKAGIKKADYAFFIGQVENLFSDPALIALDEYGIPFPLAKRLENELASNGDLDAALSKLKKLKLERLIISTFEKNLIDDVRAFI